MIKPCFKTLLLQYAHIDALLTQLPLRHHPYLFSPLLVFHHSSSSSSAPSSFHNKVARSPSPNSPPQFNLAEVSIVLTNDALESRIPVVRLVLLLPPFLPPLRLAPPHPSTHRPPPPPPPLPYPRLQRPPLVGSSQHIHSGVLRLLSPTLPTLCQPPFTSSILLYPPTPPPRLPS